MYSLGFVLLPDLPQLNVSCSPGLVSSGMLMKFIITAVCAEQSLTLNCIFLSSSPAPRWAITGQPLDTHTHILDPASPYAHTHSFHYRGVSERECSISLSASRAIHHLYRWRQARWSSVLYSLSTSLQLLYICLLFTPPSLARPSLCLFSSQTLEN